MNYLKFTIESNSNKKLDAFSKEIARTAKLTGSVVSGPIPSKGKRLVYIYSIQYKTVQSLLAINAPSKVATSVDQLTFD